LKFPGAIRAALTEYESKYSMVRDYTLVEEKE
jgi:hypothetical protein